MSATKLTLVAFAAVAVIFGGCSNNNQIVGPDLDNNSLAGSARAESNWDQAERVYLTFKAKVQRIEVERGCFIITSENGDVYTPIAPADLRLQSDMKLKVYGYVDVNMDLFCGYGSAFVIEEYDILYRPDNSDQAKTSEDRNERLDPSSLSYTSHLDEDRAPVVPSDDRDPGDVTERERDRKKKLEVERGSGPSDQGLAPIGGGVVASHGDVDDGSIDDGTGTHPGQNDDGPIDERKKKKQGDPEYGTGPGPNSVGGSPSPVTFSDNEGVNDGSDDGTGNQEGQDNGSEEERKKESQKKDPDTPSPGNNG